MTQDDEIINGLHSSNSNSICIHLREEKHTGSVASERDTLNPIIASPKKKKKKRERERKKCNAVD
ncbi:hypothetical protein Fmac_013626 [Flemingia macrophylla]|uniref:Uncharacterized protein n=1 Tax=Flemingia macrophylla TaxID=520843 RepID=A0ABD1MTN9_9FABA